MPPFLIRLAPVGVGVVCAGGATFFLCLELAGVGVVRAGGAILPCLELAGVVAVRFVGWIASCFLCLCLEPAGVVAVCLVGMRIPFLLVLVPVGVAGTGAGGWVGGLVCIDALIFSGTNHIRTRFKWVFF